MSEREVSLDGTNISIPNHPKIDNKIDQTEKIEGEFDMRKHVGRLKSGTVKTEADLLDLIISKPQDELLPWEEITLPSLGKFYNGRIPGGKIRIRPMGLFEEKIFSTGRLLASGQAVDHVFKACCKFPDNTFDPLDLLMGDRTFLLFYLRGITHGDIYEFSMTCSNEECARVFFGEYNLSKLGTTIKNPIHSSEPILIRLPYMSEMTGRDICIEGRHMRGRDINVIANAKKFKEKLSGPNVKADDERVKAIKPISYDDAIEDNLNLMITSVMNSRDPMKIQQFIAKLGSRDIAMIREILIDSAPGLNTKIIVKCPDCGTEIRTELPISEYFFRPQEFKRMRERVVSLNGTVLSA